MCVCVGNRGLGLIVQPLSSFQAWPTFYCTPQCWSCMSEPQPVVATVDPLISSPTLHRTGGQQGAQPVFYHRVLIWQDCTPPRGFEPFFYWLTTAAREPEANVTMTDKSVKYEQPSHSFLQDALWPLDVPSCQRGKFKSSFISVNSDLLVLTCCMVLATLHHCL